MRRGGASPQAMDSSSEPPSHGESKSQIRTLTQRGRERYSFWNHTLSPPPRDFELSD